MGITHKSYCKEKTGSLLGDQIDALIREMRFGQTNGIPQGSVLMDFLAEIILGYVDVELSARITKIKNYKILRYRDDYRIFCNNTKDLEFIAKALSESLADIGLKLNSSKTSISSDVIKSSIKPDKYYHIANASIYAKNLEEFIFYHTKGVIVHPMILLQNTQIQECYQHC
ncbi:MAG: RNA-directed DNA polymerase [Alistipes indistinctus]